MCVRRAMQWSSRMSCCRGWVRGRVRDEVSLTDELNIAFSRLTQKCPVDRSTRDLDTIRPGFLGRRGRHAPPRAATEECDAGRAHDGELQMFGPVRHRE